MSPQSLGRKGSHRDPFGHIGEEIAGRPLHPVVIIRHHFQVAHDAIAGMGMFVGQLNHVFPVVAERLAVFGLDHDGPVGAVGLLETGMAVEPVGAGLHDREIVGKGFSRP